jgi:hypothetical protein
MATDEAEESAETDRNILTGACWLGVMVFAETVLIFLDAVVVLGCLWFCWVGVVD